MEDGPRDRADGVPGEVTALAGGSAASALGGNPAFNLTSNPRGFSTTSLVRAGRVKVKRRGWWWAGPMRAGPAGAGPAGAGPCAASFPIPLMLPTH